MNRDAPAFLRSVKPTRAAVRAKMRALPKACLKTIDARPRRASWLLFSAAVLAGRP